VQCVSNEWLPYTKDAAASYRNTLIQPVGSPRNHQRDDESSSITSAIDTRARTNESVARRSWHPSSRCSRSTATWVSPFGTEGLRFVIVASFGVSIAKHLHVCLRARIEQVERVSEPSRPSDVWITQYKRTFESWSSLRAPATRHIADAAVVPVSRSKGMAPLLRSLLLSPKHIADRGLCTAPTPT